MSSIYMHCSNTFANAHGVISMIHVLRVSLYLTPTSGNLVFRSINSGYIPPNACFSSISLYLICSLLSLIKHSTLKRTSMSTATNPKKVVNTMSRNLFANTPNGPLHEPCLATSAALGHVPSLMKTFGSSYPQHLNLYCSMLCTNVVCLFHSGAKFALVCSVENQISRPIARVKSAQTTISQAWICRRVRFRFMKMAGTEMMNEMAMMPAFIMLAVRGHWSRRRFEAMLSRVGCFVREARVKRGMKRWRPAQMRKMRSRTMKTMRVFLRAILGGDRDGLIA